MPTASYMNIGETLRFLSCPTDTILNSTLLSSILEFQNLVVLSMDTYCPEEGGCGFHLTDDDMENLAAAIPRLKILQIGLPCRFNFCNTTVASLLSIYTHCLDLESLEIYFNTLTIVEDMQCLLSMSSGYDKAKCRLWDLVVGYILLGVGKEDIELIMMGFKVIFPCLTDFADYCGHWWKLRHKLWG